MSRWLRVIKGGKESKQCSCCICLVRFQSPEGGYDQADFWVNLGATSGFRTDPFDICSKCAGAILIELRSYIHSRVGIKKP